MDRVRRLGPFLFTIVASSARRPSPIVWMAALVVMALAACRGGDDSSGARASAIARERFVAVVDGVVLDQRTGLRWTSRDHAQALPWDEADRHCRGLVLDGATDWRLPGIEELRALYDERVEEPCGDRTCHLDPALRLTDPYVWSSSTRGPGTRFYFDFAFGNDLSPTVGPNLRRRTLCVHQTP